MAVSSVLDYTLLDEAEMAREIADFYRNLNNSLKKEDLDKLFLIKNEN